MSSIANASRKKNQGFRPDFKYGVRLTHKEIYRQIGEHKVDSFSVGFSRLSGAVRPITPEPPRR